MQALLDRLRRGRGEHRAVFAAFAAALARAMASKAAERGDTEARPGRFGEAG